MFKRLPLFFVGALLALTFNACAQEKKDVAAEAAAPVAAEVGKNYFLVEPRQPTASGDKIEVLEVFSYACIHCAHFQPYADEIKSKLPAYAKFEYMPAIFNEAWEAYARAFYTAQSLGMLDKTHQAIFDAVHRDHRQFRSFDDIAAYYGEQGADVAKFKQTATSFEVESKLARSRDLVPKYGVDGTPTLIIDGKYRLTGASAGGYPQLVALVDLLVKKAHAEKAAK
ncbi:thiol:disulfide interchange protein DsbA/DsbL [Dokdonella sp.]|uniref:thiol:disulfide interchange protein DsbA/DsbL n=1 Tax=Dokdonella sp. TaxID=2291710 RepID=UPI002B79A89A|nr:thiol:disulfide interchange protein DsbA/DsbL [Dokdonella sp.]HOX72689.1 thiol:disulfide interchange protein DsbA/DsbL [Dokdonella sp.]HPN78162.1 thiol:disulfide interchange protein DsbA/DsbL [Dokdonella sp.]